MAEPFHSPQLGGNHQATQVEVGRLVHPIIYRFFLAPSKRLGDLHDGHWVGFFLSVLDTKALRDLNGVIANSTYRDEINFS